MERERQTECYRAGSLLLAHYGSFSMDYTRSVLPAEALFSFLLLLFPTLVWATMADHFSAGQVLFSGVISLTNAWCTSRPGKKRYTLEHEFGLTRHHATTGVGRYCINVEHARLTHGKTKVSLSGPLSSLSG